jgi:hypothetical protein
MKVVFSLLIVWGVFYLGKLLLSEYDSVRKQPSRSQYGEQAGPVQPSVLPGLPASLEHTLEAARLQGAAGLRTWLKGYGPYARDPRLADIELDYVVLVSRDNPMEARRIFQQVQKRTLPSSPVYERVKRLEKNYQ